MIGSQKRKALVYALAAIAALVCGVMAFGQDVQTGSYVLAGASAIVEGSTALTDQIQLLDLLEAAGTGGFLTDDQAIAILDAAGVRSLDEGAPGAAAQVQNALVMVLDAINAGTIDPEGAVTALNVSMAQSDPLGALSAVLDEQASPAGVLKAIGNATLKVGYTQSESTALFDEVKIAIQEGVPPGIAVRVTKQALRSVLNPQEQIELVATLLEEEGASPGLAANAATGNGNQSDQTNSSTDSHDHGSGKGNTNGQANGSSHSGKPDKGNQGHGNKD